MQLDGQDITGWSMNRIAREGRMLRSFQKTVVFTTMTSEENLIVGRADVRLSRACCRPSRLGPASRRRVARLRERAQASDRDGRACRTCAHQPAGNLSGGQQKLLQFASMLMPEPKLILLDEPMAGINPMLIERVVESIRIANRELGVTFLVIEHNIDV